MNKRNEIIVGCNTKPFIKAFAGDFLIIQENHPHFKKHLCNNFNQIWYIYNNITGVGHCFNVFNVYPPIIQEDIKYDNMSDDEIIEYIYECLCQGYHVKTFVNEKYLPCKNIKIDLEHDNNIYGLSFKENKVKFFGINNRMFTADESSIEEYLQAFRNMDEYHPITRLKAKDFYCLNFEHIIYSLEEYLNSGENSGAEKEAGYHLGFDACYKLIDMIQEIIDEKQHPNQQQIYSFMEHKKSMAYKAVYFKEFGINISNEIISKSEHIYMKAQKNIMYLLKYEQTGNKKYLYNIIDNITESIEIEKIYIKNLLDEIKLYAVNKYNKNCVQNKYMPFIQYNKFDNSQANIDIIDNKFVVLKNKDCICYSTRMVGVFYDTVIKIENVLLEGKGYIKIFANDFSNQVCHLELNAENKNGDGIYIARWNHSDPVKYHVPLDLIVMAEGDDDFSVGLEWYGFFAQSSNNLLAYHNISETSNTLIQIKNIDGYYEYDKVISKDGWILFKDIDLDDFSEIEVEITDSNKSNNLNIGIDNCTEHSIIANTERVNDYIIYKLKHVKGRHDLYVCSTSTDDIKIGNIRFIQDAYSPLCAADYSWLSDMRVSYYSGFYHLALIKNNSFVMYRNLNFHIPTNAVALEYASISEGVIEIYTDQIDGNPIGTHNFINTGGMDKFIKTNCDISPIEGRHDLHFVFKGSNDTIQFKSFEFLKG